MCGYFNWGCVKRTTIPNGNVLKHDSKENCNVRSSNLEVQKRANVKTQSDLSFLKNYKT